ncbi:uncharacterized protein LOC142323418 [Lycorma delicatula]|uniref:uncharacterized protein LOC142323418 n=1 Tax=Lycorma delicatula TaxID=130591 RepID=UPI003F50D934
MCTMRPVSLSPPLRYHCHYIKGETGRWNSISGESYHDPEHRPRRPHSANLKQPQVLLKGAYTWRLILNIILIKYTGMMCCGTMRFQAALLLAIGITLAIAADKKAADSKPAAADGERPKIFSRVIPADVLRDFPGMCFASTRCATIEPGHTWELSPFCGRSKCHKEGDHLFELVEDCGPLPIANDKCKFSEKTNKTAPFPDCCPIFECEPGVKLEYPEIPAAAEVTPAPAAAAAKPKA